jgi:hypothetical protein
VIVVRGGGCRRTGAWIGRRGRQVDVVAIQVAVGQSPEKTKTDSGQVRNPVLG